ncbi:uncharacterized protein LOC142337289 isoform X2 [Convolutriloba macropyga]|uniref:uncharacterized protein LOC142337289 isoform X2 n=1 Tax=Convolutriloba macropyga TaxID=536237 RepID=UPI003F52751E
MSTKPGLGVPSIVVDEDVSQGNNAAVPSFEQEREMYGRPKRVKKGDLEKYVTRNYDEAQSGSADFLDPGVMTGEGMQNEQNSMNVQLSKSLTPVLKVDKLDESGDSFHRADNIERDNAAAGLKAPSVMVDEELSQGNHVALPSFDRERETYGTPKKVKSGDLAKYVTSNYDEAQSSAPVTPTDGLLAVNVSPAVAENSMKVELSMGEQDIKAGEAKKKKHRHKMRKSKPSVDSTDKEQTKSRKRDDADDDENKQDTSLTALKMLTCCIEK